MRAWRLLLLSSVAWGCWGAAHAQEPATTVEAVVLTGTPYPVSLDSATTHIEALTGEELARTAPVGLGDALADIPGLRSTAYGPGASRPVIRGLGGPRVMILQNGTGLVDASSLSPDHAVAADPGHASRIEVLRGPSALAYGGSAIGGVVNVIDERIADSPAANGLEGGFTTSIQDSNSGVAANFAIKRGEGPWVVTLDGEFRDAGDIRIGGPPVSAVFEAGEGVVARPDRRLLNSDVSAQALGAGVSYVTDEGFLGVSVKQTDSEYGVPFPQFVGNVPPAGEGPIGIDMSQTRFDVRGERDVRFGPFDKARFSAGYTDYEHAELDRGAGNAVGVRFLSQGAEGRFELIQRERHGRLGAVGLQLLSREFQALGDEAFVPPVDIGEAGGFVLQRYDAGRWGIEGGLRIDQRSLDAQLAGRGTSGAANLIFGPGFDWATAQGSQDFGNVSASAAAFYRPTEAWFLGLSVSRNARAPSEFELFSDGPHEGTESYQLGDPTLRSEKVVSAEATIRWRGPRLRLEAHLFSADYDGFIEERNTGVEVDEDGDPLGPPELPLYVFTQSDARFSGGEAEARLTLTEGERGSWFVEGAVDFVRGTTAFGPASRIPPVSYTGRLLFEAARWDASLEVRRVEDQNRLAADETPTPGYTLVNVEVGYRPWADHDVVVFADLHNLTDETTREHTSFLKDFAPGAGRSVRLGTSVRF